MKLEVANKQPAGTYWVASIVMTCGQLLRLRHEGVTPDDSSADFWCDVISSDIHPIGWCRQNSKKQQPPEGGWKLWKGCAWGRVGGCVGG